MQSTKKYWKGIEELKESPGFVEIQQKEFAQELPLEEVLGNDKPLAGNRRDFLKMMGFSLTAATIAASCEVPVRKAIPYVIKPEEITPGVANWYASTFFDGSEYCSILVKAREGRPIKIEGNEMSTITQGGTSAKVQASVLSLYDTARLRAPMINGTEASWEIVDSQIKSKLEELKSSNGNIRILSSTIISPSTQSVIADFTAKYPATKHVTYDAVSYSGILNANEKLMGKRIIPTYKFDNAHVIVSFGADFLGTWLSPVEFTKQYIRKRKVTADSPKMSRHFQFESALSVTGSNADVRATLKPSQVGLALLNLYNAIASLSGNPAVSGVEQYDLAGGSIAMAAKELWNNKGKALVVCGSNNTSHQIIVNGINKMLDSYGNTIDAENYNTTKQGNDKEVMELVSEMNEGKVGALIIWNVNPAYDFTDAGKFMEAMKKVGTTISFNEKMDETASLCKYACPDNNFLESWNDAEPIKGKYSLQQPTIAPLFKTRQAQDSLLKWADANTDYYAYLANYWSNNLFKLQNKYLTAQSFWDNSLKDGVFEASMMAPPATDAKETKNNKKQETAKEQPATNMQAAWDEAVANIMKSKPSDGVEVVLYEKVGMGNGKYANNPWLQEMPDSVSKVVWDNYASVSPKFARDQGFHKAIKFSEDGSVADRDTEMLMVKTDKGSIELPVLVQPGQAYGTVAIAVGYGRTKAGKAINTIGKNAFPLATYNGENIEMSGTAQIQPTGNSYQLAQTQTHHNIEGRRIVKETTLAEYASNHKAGNEDREFVKKHLTTLYSAHKYEGHHWAMAIDLNACTGCGACVVACQVENNVPVVGKEEVMLSREMHWLRIDRYFSGTEENPEVIFQPMLCQHCGNAPCENVCPVAATNHSSEGLNQMAYNRCIGTRYCENNCPFKVRRFNWFDYQNAGAWKMNVHDVGGMTEDLSRMVLNPDVTVRSRGVMEKCSFCVQRIQDSKLNAKKDGRKLKDGEIRTACMQACPANAIVFGDTNDPNSEVSKWMKNERNYLVLEELHVLPSVNYLTKVRNREKMA